EKISSPNCGNCDNCLNPREKLEVKDSVKIVLDAINALDERFGIDYVVDMVMGKATPQISTFRHDKLKIFGSGKIMEMNENFWQSLVRQMMLEGFIYKDIEEYGLLKTTTLGKKFLKKPFSIKVSLNHEYEEVEDDDDYVNTGTSGAALDETLFE